MCWSMFTALAVLKFCNTKVLKSNRLEKQEMMTFNAFIGGRRQAIGILAAIKIFNCKRNAGYFR